MEQQQQAAKVSTTYTTFRHAACVGVDGRIDTKALPPFSVCLAVLQMEVPTLCLYYYADDDDGAYQQQTTNPAVAYHRLGTWYHTNGR